VDTKSDSITECTQEIVTRSDSDLPVTLEKDSEQRRLFKINPQWPHRRQRTLTPTFRRQVPTLRETVAWSHDFYYYNSFTNAYFRPRCDALVMLPKSSAAPSVGTLHQYMPRDLFSDSPIIFSSSFFLSSRPHAVSPFSCLLYYTLRRFYLVQYFASIILSPLSSPLI
jgi:hypothetical protein